MQLSHCATKLHLLYLFSVMGLLAHFLVDNDIKINCLALPTLSSNSSDTILLSLKLTGT